MPYYSNGREIAKLLRLDLDERSLYLASGLAHNRVFGAAPVSVMVIVKKTKKGLGGGQ